MLANTIEAIRKDAALPYSRALVLRATGENIVRQRDIAFGTAGKAIQQVKIDPKGITRLHAKVARARVLPHFEQQRRKHMNEKCFDLSATRTEADCMRTGPRIDHGAYRGSSIKQCIMVLCPDGNGPALLAHVILLDHTMNSECTCTDVLHVAFKDAFVAHWKHDEWKLKAKDLTVWIAAQIAIDPELKERMQINSY